MENTDGRRAAIPFDQLPEDGLIRQAQLLNGILPFTATTLWRQVKAQKFPAPHRLKDIRATCWRVGDVRQWLAAQGGAK